METLYDVLEVSRKASKEVIEKAYKTLAKKYHPDVQTPENKAIAEEKMKKINDAYDVLSDEQKKSEYDAKLEEEDKNINRQTNYNQNNYDNSQYSSNNQNNGYANSQYASNKQNNGYTNPSYSNTNTNENMEYGDWRDVYSKLSRREQAKLRRKIEREANEEYRQMYEDYLRRLGYRVRHRWTFKDFVNIGILIIILMSIFFIMWWVPQTHEWMINLYNQNFLIRVIVNIIIGIFKGIFKFFSNIFKI